MLIAKAKVWTPLSKNESGATLYLPAHIIKKIHRKKGCLNVWYPKIPSPMLHLYLFQASERQPELVLPSLVQDYSPCYMKESKTLIQILVAVQSYTEITCMGTAAWKQSYLPENYISQMQRLNFFRTEYLHKHWELTGLLVKITYKKFNLFSE